MEPRISPSPRGPIDISRMGAIVVLLWSALIVELGMLAVVMGWAPGGPASRLLDALLWPGSLLALVALGALPRRGGLLLGVLGGLLVGLACALVISVLPDSQLPLYAASPDLRVRAILEAVWAMPIAGLSLGAVGVGVRRGIRHRWPHRLAAPTPFAIVGGGNEADPETRLDVASSGSALGTPRPGYMPVGLAIAAGASVSLTAGSTASELAPAPR